MKGKQVIVTGGLGFIGSQLVERLVEDNDVAIIDNQSTGKLENVSHLIGDNLKVIDGDIQTLNLAAIFEDHEYVFHQAALPSVPRSVKDPLASHEANVTGTLRVLIAAKDANIKKVVFASSSSVYGDTTELPKREDMPVNPPSPYAVTKVAGEFYCKVFHEIYGLPTISLRYFNVFGPRQDPLSQYAAVIPKFITAMLDYLSPIIYGDGQQSRDFTFVKHVVDANVLACESNKTGTFNVACGRSISINELVALIGERTGKTIQAQHVAPRPGDVKHSLADISKARSFGYVPMGNFKNELRETIRWFENGLRPDNRG
ncbi:MAG: SDR family oxidoreductase [Halobacteriota archaeon]